MNMQKATRLNYGMLSVNTAAVRVQPLHDHWLNEHGVSLDILRLDEVHPVVSGNKWYKLQHYLQEAVVPVPTAQVICAYCSNCGASFKICAAPSAPFSP